MFRVHAKVFIRWVSMGMSDNMEEINGIPIPTIIATRMAVSGLKTKEAPYSLGYNDMAVMLSFGRTKELGSPIFTANQVADFLGRHMAVPEDSRMPEVDVSRYFAELKSYSLLEQVQDKFEMRDDISYSIWSDYKNLKSPHIDDFLFHGFTLMSSQWAFDQRTHGFTKEQKDEFTSKLFR